MSASALKPLTFLKINFFFYLHKCCLHFTSLLSNSYSFVFPLIYLCLYRVMVTSVLADRHPGELHIFRNYDPPSVLREPPYATTATFKPLTIPQGTSANCWSTSLLVKYCIEGVLRCFDMTTGWHQRKQFKPYIEWLYILGLGNLNRK